jgi:hypothetical protein
MNRPDSNPLVKSQRTKRRPKGLKLVSRWHRRVGVASALTVLFLAVTGIALNHLEDVYHSGETVTSEWVLDWYNIPYSETVLSFTLEPSAEKGALTMVWADGTIAVNKVPIKSNQSRLLAVVQYQQLLHLFTQSNLHILDLSGQLVESSALLESDTVVGVQLTEQENMLALTTFTGVHLYDLEQLEFSTKAEPPNVTTRHGNIAPRQHHLGEPEFATSRNYTLLKSKVLTDLHSGRVFGQIGVWIIDFFALLFILLAGSGLFMWLKRQNK